MILGLGNDLVDIRRIEQLLKKFPLRFQNSVFTAEERTYALRCQPAAPAFARRFSAKEACAKALGVGLKILGTKTPDGIRWQEVEVLSSATGQPFLHLTGNALARLQAMTPAHMTPVVHISLSDQYPYALATVILAATAVEGG
ncbi:MAG: holo-ACP synthase [Holosporales bacterium]|jgi:holo-[acyl-carrier protein] synthase|nr:holo-ACP synthase [Holosporales bacterium]